MKISYITLWVTDINEQTWFSLNTIARLVTVKKLGTKEMKLRTV
jgi:hypothetical protein